MSSKVEVILSSRGLSSMARLSSFSEASYSEILRRLRGGICMRGRLGLRTYERPKAIPSTRCAPAEDI